MQGVAFSKKVSPGLGAKLFWEMSFSLGLVGLPNSGKTTLFSALTGGEIKISPHKYNLGTVGVRDARLQALQKVFQAGKTVPVYITFIDFMPFAQKERIGELGSQFLTQAKECSALLVVLRGFPDPLPPQPLKEAESINLEMLLSDLKITENVLEKREKLLKLGQKEYQREVELLKKVKAALEEETPLREVPLSKEEKVMLGLRTDLERLFMDRRRRVKPHRD